MFPDGIKLTPRRRQGGAAIIEFALVAMIFLTLLIGIMEFGRWLFALNGASEATRWGARLAVVCDKTDAQKTKIKQRMQIMLHGVTNDQINIEYLPDNNCTQETCTDVIVYLKGATFTPLIPFLGGAYGIPSYTVSVPRESMDSAGGDNEVCS